jgi:hypothetical protein
MDMNRGYIHMYVFMEALRSRVKAQPLHASDDDIDSAVHTTDDSDPDERANKRSKN